MACYVWATTADPVTALAWLKNPGPHGFSEMLYEFTSAAANNGAGFEGLGDNTPFWNISTGVVMLLSRYIPIIAPLALAGFLAAKPASPETALAPGRTVAALRNAGSRTRRGNRDLAHLRAGSPQPDSTVVASSPRGRERMDEDIH